MLSPTEAFPTGASRGWCVGAEEHFPVGAGGQRLMGEMRGWAVAGIMEKVALIAGADSV